jgi:hypothetical protein
MEIGELFVALGMIVFFIETLQQIGGDRSSLMFFSSTFGGDSSNVPNLVASGDLHNLQLTWNLVEMGSN